jgi:hypothetical protein
MKDIILNTMKKESYDLQKHDLKPEIVPNLMYSQNPLWVCEMICTTESRVYEPRGIN